MISKNICRVMVTFIETKTGGENIVIRTTDFIGEAVNNVAEITLKQISFFKYLVSTFNTNVPSPKNFIWLMLSLKSIKLQINN